MLDEYLRLIRAATVYDVAIRTPLELAPVLSERLHNEILIKREDTQRVHSFKLRGAYNKIFNLSPEVRQRGVITASAGNHAQGVAMAAKRMNIPALIVMPETTPEIKLTAVRGWQAEIVLHGNTYDEALVHARLLEQERGYTFVHPYDDPHVIAGQGTVALEILEQFTDPIHAIFVPVGGGGLLAGTIAAVKSLRPETKVIGVEPEDAACLHAAMRAQERVVLDHVGIFADGVAVAQVGKEPFRLIAPHVDEVLTATTDEICAALKDIFDDRRNIAEPAGALALAGLKRYVKREGIRDKVLVPIVSGANINFDRLRHVAERAELGENREVLFAATIDEQPGSFRRFCEAIGSRSVTEFNYRYANGKQAHVFVGVQLPPGLEQRRPFLLSLRQAGYAVVDLSDDEMAKCHIRYMVGGRTDSADGERLFRFEFPERPGALMRFLERLGTQWNISLFHYRNHGAAYGRVLVGIQVPAGDDRKFAEFLAGSAYRYTEESENPAYTFFLR